MTKQEANWVAQKVLVTQVSNLLQELNRYNREVISSEELFKVQSTISDWYMRFVEIHAHKLIITEE
jgi:hypothetical protein